MQDSPDLSSIEGTMEQEIHAVFQCLLSIICLCCHGKGYGISIRKVAPQCIQHQSRIRRDVEVNEDAFVLCFLQFFNNSFIPGSCTQFDAKFAAHCREGGDKKRIGRHEERLNCTRFTSFST